MKLAAVAVSENIVDRAQRLADLKASVAEAAQAGAEMIVFPESCISHRTDEGIAAYEGNKLIDMARAIDDPEIDQFRLLAEEHNLILVINTEELDDGKIYNSSIVYSSQGACIGKYRKRFLPDPEIALGFEPGAYTPPIETPFGKMGIQVCWEMHFPDIAMRHLIEGADFFLWLTMPFDIHVAGFTNRMSCRAADLCAPLVCVTHALPDERIANWDGIVCMAVDALGRVVGSAPQRPGVHIFDVDPQQHLDSPHTSFDNHRAYMQSMRKDYAVLRGN